VPRLKILQIFSRYLQYGGEEGSVYRIGDTLQDCFDVEYFIASTEKLLKLPKWQVAGYSYRNLPLLGRLEKYQKLGQFNCWLIHNVFPAVSPGAYTLAAKLEVPIVHYLHNYRMGCVNGFWFTEGQECRKCSGGNFIPGAVGKCWRGSLAESSAMALMLADVRRRGLFQQVRRWVAISHAQKALHVAMGIPEERIDVVHHFLNHDPQSPIPALPADGYGLFIGRLSPEKGVNRLLEAWAKLGRERKLVIAGDGPELPALQAQAAALGLQHVTFAGFVNATAQKQLWAGAAFSIVPSMWQEPFGMVILESWAKGRPVVAHRNGALGEIISEGENGFLADPARPDDLAEALERAFQAGPRQLTEMGQQGHEQLISYYHRARWLQDIQRVFQNANLIH
jgi:glycosyltransferase involved in cell wall biosynthesis